MTIEEVFNKLVSHMQEGVQYHNEFARAFDFLGLYGFAHCHIYHSLEETEGYHKMMHYYSTHYHKLLTLTPEKHELIPPTWYKYSSSAVDLSTRKGAIRDFFTKWIEWERATKQLYQDMRKELYIEGEVAAALFLDNYVLDVTHELKHAEKILLKIEAINYDAPTIIEWQKPLKDKYTKKLGW